MDISLFFRWSTRLRAPWLLLPALLGLAAACPAAPLVIAIMPTPLSLPVTVAQTQGYFADEGVEVKVAECTTGPRCLQQLFARQAQLVTTSEFPVMLASFERSDLAIVGTIASATGNTRLIARKSAGIQRAEDLPGKRVGVILGSSAQYYLDTYLMFHALDPRQVVQVPLLPEHIANAVAQEQVDALVAGSRHTTPALKGLGADGLLLDDPRIYTETFNLVADRHTIVQRGVDLAKVLRAIERAERFIHEQPQQARRILQSRLPDTLQLDQTIHYRLGLDQSLIAALEGQARWALREGHVPPGRKIPNYLDFVEPGPLRFAAPSALPPTSLTGRPMDTRPLAVMARRLARMFRRGRAHAAVAGRTGVVETAAAKAGGPLRGVEAASGRPDATARLKRPGEISGLLLWCCALALPCAAVRAEALRLGVSHGPVSLPIYVAQAQGYFTQAGLALQLRDCSSGRQCFALQVEKQVDVATAAELLVTLDSLSRQADTAVIATLSASTHHIKLVARRSAGITVPGDLRRKRIATVAGTSAQYFLDSWLVFHEIDPKDVDTVTLPPDRLGAALGRGEVDAVAIWEPVASAALQALGQDAVVLPSPRVYTQHFNLVTSRRFIAQREADLVKLLHALARAQRFIADNPAEAARVLQERFPDEANPGKLSEHNYSLSLSQSLISTMDAQARWARRRALAPAGQGNDNLLRSIEPGPLRKAVPGAVTLVQ